MEIIFWLVLFFQTDFVYILINFLFTFAGDLCAAKFVDNQWYRAKVEKVSGTEATVLYVDFGNRATIPRTKCGVLPASFSTLPAFAKEYALAFMALPPDVRIALFPLSSSFFNNV